jgi:hypothetical protein
MTIPAAAYVEISRKALCGEIDGQKKSPPVYWVEVTSGMRGFFAVLLWDGMGFPEPWETGIGSYKTAAQAAVEAQQWAEAEGIEFRTRP